MSWRYLGIFAAAADHGLPGPVWECPDVFTIDGTAVVIVSVAEPGTPYAIWMTGDITGGRFQPRASGRCDGGDRYYAPQSLSLPAGRRIGIGWLRETPDELAGPDRTRVGAMSLPRELYLEAGDCAAGPSASLTARGRERLAGQVIEGHGTVSLTLSARERSAAELRVTPARGARIDAWSSGRAAVSHDG